MIQIVFKTAYSFCYSHKEWACKHFKVPLDTQRGQFKTKSFHATGSTGINPNARQPT